MIEPGDRVMVCLSGGKDSYSLLDILIELRARAPIAFEIVAVNLDQKQPGFPADVLPAYLRQRSASTFRIVEQDTYSIVKRLVPEGKTMCSLCSRLRRGILYRVAGELGATKIALGHHRDDMVQTLFMNMFFGGRLKGMPPKLVSDDGRHVVIRPLAYVAEADLARWAARSAASRSSRATCAAARATCSGSRSAQMLRDWEREQPGRIDRIFRAMARRRAVAPDGPEPASLRRRSNRPASPTPRATGPSTTRIEACGPGSEVAAESIGSPARARRRPRRRVETDMSTTIAAALAVAARSSGCASLNALDSDVSSFSRWPAGRAPATYAFERLPSQQARPQQAQMLEDAARRAVEAAGFVPRRRGRRARRHASRSARASPRPTARPSTTRSGTAGCGPWLPAVPGRYGRGYGRPYWGPYWGPRTLRRLGSRLLRLPVTTSARSRS